jgi:hypothetical protein
MLYTVVAYRWGWVNNHTYTVAVTQNADLARTKAEEECADRGGKYGVAVYEWTDETTQRRIAYFASQYEETVPAQNPRIEMFERIGHNVHEVATTGLVWEAPEGHSGPAVPTPVDAPEWMIAKVRQHELLSRMSIALQAHPNLSQLSSEEGRAWIAAQQAADEKAVDELFAKVSDLREDALRRAAERAKGT